jgi:hypothetical protein
VGRNSGGAVDCGPDDGDDRKEQKKLRENMIVSPCVFEYEDDSDNGDEEVETK